MMQKYKRPGWYGNSQGHAMAARGIRLYSKKQVLMDPLFYAQKREETVSFNHMQGMAREEKTWQEMQAMHPKADPEDLRIRGIKAYESIDGDSTLSSLNKNGIDVSVQMAQNSDMTKAKMKAVINDSKRSTFLPKVKVDLLKERLK